MDLREKTENLKKLEDKTVRFQPNLINQDRSWDSCEAKRKAKSDWMKKYWGARKSKNPK